MYVAVKGGERAIEKAHELLARERRGDDTVAEIAPAQIEEQLSLGVARVMAEGSLYDPGLAAIAIKQARGDLIEAIFLVRAYRTTLPRFGYSSPVETGRMAVRRRVSATFKDIPGGQILGPTFDYTHRLIDFSLGDTKPSPTGRTLGEGNGLPENNPESPTAAGTSSPSRSSRAQADAAPMPRVLDILSHDGLIEPSGSEGTQGSEPGDITRQPLDFPASRDVRLQVLARGDEGFLLALGYSTQRGYGRTHPFAGEIRIGECRVEAFLPELGFAVEIGEITLTECEMINQFKGSKTEPPQFTRGYGLVFGQAERKAMAMALVDRSLRAKELDEFTGVPAQDEEFVLAHSDNVQATGFVEHLKLPHYVDFQSELELIRRLRLEAEQGAGADEGPISKAAE
jgi:alpha-D-ribose 1-methylphosphonate 5-triphosphate synthase subunit PhnI